MEGILGLFWIAVIFIIYFLPFMIARERKHKNKLVIGWINFLLGWTLIGWLVAFFWSLTANVEPKTA